MSLENYARRLAAMVVLWFPGGYNLATPQWRYTLLYWMRRPHERDVASDLVAVGVANHFLVRKRRPDVVDAKVEGGDPSLRNQRHDDRPPAGGVDQARNATAVKDAGFRIANQVLAVRQGK